VFWLCVLESAQTLYPSIQTTTIKDLYVQAEKLFNIAFEFDEKTAKELSESCHAFGVLVQKWKYTKIDTKADPPSNSPQDTAANVLTNGFRSMTTFRETWGNIVAFMGKFTDVFNKFLNEPIEEYVKSANLVDDTGSEKKHWLIAQVFQVCQVAYELKMVVAVYNEVNKDVIDGLNTKAAKMAGFKPEELPKAREALMDDCAQAIKKIKDITEKQEKKVVDEYNKSISDLTKQAAGESSSSS